MKDNGKEKPTHPLHPLSKLREGKPRSGEVSTSPVFALTRLTPSPILGEGEPCHRLMTVPLYWMRGVSQRKNAFT
jgi:hypothetical protein